ASAYVFASFASFTACAKWVRGTEPWRWNLMIVSPRRKTPHPRRRRADAPALQPPPSIPSGRADARRLACRRAPSPHPRDEDRRFHAVERITLLANRQRNHICVVLTLDANQHLLEVVDLDGAIGELAPLIRRRNRTGAHVRSAIAVVAVLDE